MALAPAAALVVVGLAGCSSSGAHGADSASTAQSAAGTHVAFTTADFAKRVGAAQDTVTSERMSVVATSGGNKITVTSDLARHGDAMDMNMTLQYPDSDPWKVRLVDGIYYIDLGSLSGNKFVTFDPKNPGSLGAMGSTFTGLTQQADPSAEIDAFKDSVVSVDKQGPADSDGVQEYTAVMETSKIGGVIGQQLKAAGGTASLPSTLTYHFWIDPQDRVHKLTADIGSTTSETTFSNFGEKVTVEKPAASEITSADSLGS